MRHESTKKMTEQEIQATLARIETILDEIEHKMRTLGWGEYQQNEWYRRAADRLSRPDVMN